MAATARNSVPLRPIDLALAGRALAGAMALVFAAQFLLILAAGHRGGAVSGYCTSALVTVAAASLLWRALLLARRERAPWLWTALAIALWAVAHALEARFQHAPAGDILSVDAAFFLYIGAMLSVIAALSSTHETQAVRAVSVLNFAQIALALLLAWFLLGRPAPPASHAASMRQIEDAAGLLLVALGLLRLFSCATREEKHCFRTINLLLWTYVPVDLAMYYLWSHHGLKSGTLLDLLWNLPFALAAWKALTLPLDKAEPPAIPERSRARMLVESLCPLLLTAATFALAAAVVPRHLALGLAAMFFLLVVQGFQAAVVQVNYLQSHRLLIDREHKLRSANASLEQLTLLDPLTGISNRRAFDNAFAAAWRRAVRRHSPLALLMVDIDFFKGVNDQHGHAYGDECLATLARVLDAQTRRPDDLLARLGGEEFVLLLPETTADGALKVAHRLHEAVRHRALANNASPFDRLLTISIGIAICLPAPGLQPNAVFEAADQALYSAKDQGRNRTFSVLLRPEDSGIPDAAAAHTSLAPQTTID